jgi:hypothetical protein
VAAAYDSLLAFGAGDATDALTLFREHHLANAASFDTLTEDEGGTAFAEANPALQGDLIEPTLAVIEAQADPAQMAASVVVFAHSLENIAASTFQAFVPVLTKRELRSAVSGVGTVEAMHSAVLAGLIEGAQPAPGLDTLDSFATTVPPTTTAEQGPSSGTTTTTHPALALPAEGVFQVTGAFGSLVEALGPNSYVYDERTLVTTAEG